jgi:epoxide hydrolase 4
MRPIRPNKLAYDLNSITQGHFYQGGATSAVDQKPVRLHYAACGTSTKPLMILLHGFPEFWQAYADVMPLLAGEFYVVAPDLRGFNLSDKPSAVESYKPALIVADICALAKHLGAETFTLVAHDWGGAIAWNLAAGFPSVLTQLVILNSPHPVTFASALANDAPQQAASQYMNWLRAEGSELRLEENNFERLAGFFQEMGGKAPNAWFQGQTKSAYIKAWSQPGAMKGNVNYYRVSPLYPPHGSDLGAKKLTLDETKFIVQVRTLVLWGDGDVALLPIVLEGLDRLVPGIQIVRWPDATHWLLHEHPRRCADAILAFTNANPAHCRAD